MISAKVTYVDKSQQVMKAIDKGAYKSFAHTAASVRKSAIASVKITKETIGWITTKRTSKRGRRIRARIYRPSPVGTPVHSHRNKGFVSRGIRFDASKSGAVIGFAKSVYGTVMGVHEHGGTRLGQSFSPRPVMWPALEQNINRISQSWRGSISA